MELSQTLRAQIVALVQSGMTQSAVSRQLKTSRQNVSRTMIRYNATNSFASRARRGRPRTTSATTDRAIKRLVTSNPFVSSREVSREVSGVSRISSRTVRRRLSDTFSLKSRKPAKKPLLSIKNIQDRMKFCHKYKHWTATDWNKVLFSDETTVRQFANAGKASVRRPKGERFNPRYCLPPLNMHQAQ